MNERRTDAEAGEGDGDGPLMAVLRQLIRRDGREETAELLGVSERTLFRTLAEGRLTARMRDALALHVLSEGGEDATGREAHGTALKQKVEELAERVDALGEKLHTGLAAVRGEAGEREEDGSGPDAGYEERAAAPPSVKGGPEQVIGQPAVQRPWRPYPQLVTKEREAGEELVYGKAAPAIAEWREAMAALGQAKRRLDRLDAERRVLELEVVLIEDHGLTLPPAVYPWDRFGRRDEVWRKRRVLETIRRARRRALLLRWVRRVLTLGLWWK